MSITMSVSLLFIGLVLLVLFHVCISGVISRRNVRESMVERGTSGSITMSVDDLEKLPCYNYIARDITSSPVDCAVCLETLITGDKCRLLPICKHSFHAHCVDKWLLKTPFCPICRSSAGRSESGLFMNVGIELRENQRLGQETDENQMVSANTTLSQNIRVDKLPMDFWNWSRTVFPTPVLLASIFILNITMEFSTSWALERHVHKVLRCLGTQNTYSENETAEDNIKRASIRDTWILIGAIMSVILIIVIIAYILYHRYFKSSEHKIKETFEDMLKNTACPRISVKEVYAATNHLNEMNVIGEGTAGKVYKGKMENNQHVAVKHIMNDDGNMETFAREITSLSHVRHPNLVPLLGFCVKGDDCFLVYELCPNGTLSDWLFGKNKVLSWIQRLEIAIDSARGLWFLHTYPGGCIVHRDIKPTNILLGPKFEAKLSDFGLSKIIEVGETYVSSEVRGTFGYVDPEYQRNHHVNSSGDVYSFGMVLLQILSGKKAINLNLKKPMSLSRMAKALSRNGSITKFADPKLEGEYSEEAFYFTLKLALSCTALNHQRPSMEDVFRKLQEALLISKERKVSVTETPV